MHFLSACDAGARWQKSGARWLRAAAGSLEAPKALNRRHAGNNLSARGCQAAPPESAAGDALHKPPNASGAVLAFLRAASAELQASSSHLANAAHKPRPESRRRILWFSTVETIQHVVGEPLTQPGLLKTVISQSFHVLMLHALTNMP